MYNLVGRTFAGRGSFRHYEVQVRLSGRQSPRKHIDWHRSSDEDSQDENEDSPAEDEDSQADDDQED